MTRPMNGHRGLLVAAVAVLVAACGGAPSSSSPTAPTATAAASEGDASGDLCGTVSRERAEAAMGGPVSDGEGGDLFPEGTYCVFDTDDPAVRVEVQVVELARAQFDENVGNFGLTETTSSAGEVAFVRETSVQGVTGSWLYAFGSGRAISVDVQGPDDQAAQLEAMRAIVEAVLAGR